MGHSLVHGPLQQQEVHQGIGLGTMEQWAVHRQTMSLAVALVGSLEEETDQDVLLPSAHHLGSLLAVKAGHAEGQEEVATG